MVEIAIGCPLISTVPPGTRTIRPSWSTMTEAGWSMRVTVPVTTVCAAAAPTSASTSPPATMRVRANICVLPLVERVVRSVPEGASGLPAEATVSDAFVIFTIVARRRHQDRRTKSRTQSRTQRQIKRGTKRRPAPPPARLGAGEARLLTLARDLTALITTATPSRLLDAALERLPSGARPRAKRPSATSPGGKTKAPAPAWAHEHARPAMHENPQHATRPRALRGGPSRPPPARLLVAGPGAGAGER